MKKPNNKNCNNAILLCHNNQDNSQTMFLKEIIS